MWEMLQEDERSLVGELYARILIARSLPDVHRVAFYLSQVTGLARETCGILARAAYPPEVLEAEVLLAVRPTLRYLDVIGVSQTRSFQEAYRNYDYNHA
jgi:hypothetical protein